MKLLPIWFFLNATAYNDKLNVQIGDPVNSNYGLRRIPQCDEETNASGPSHFGEYPWVAEVVYKHTKRHVVQATIIHPSVLISVIFNVERKDYDGYLVRGGIWKRNQSMEGYPMQERNIKAMREYIKGKVYMHFTSFIILTEPFILSDHLNTICLTDVSPTSENFRNCVTSGFRRFKNGTTEKILSKRLMKIVNMSEIQMIDIDYIRANVSEDIDSCVGSRLPLYCQMPETNGRYYLVGNDGESYEKFRTGQCTGNDTIVYEDVTKFKKLVDSEMKKYGFGKCFYTY